MFFQASRENTPNQWLTVFPLNRCTQLLVITYKEQQIIWWNVASIACTVKPKWLHLYFNECMGQKHVSLQYFPCLAIEKFDSCQEGWLRTCNTKPSIALKSGNTLKSHRQGNKHTGSHKRILLLLAPTRNELFPFRQKIFCFILVLHKIWLKFRRNVGQMSEPVA